jgi:uncharacterized protein YbaP (TraB family)
LPKTINSRHPYLRSAVRTLFKRSLILAAILYATGAFAQKQSNYSLLWKISGKGMAKPSFLFGTMHVSDKRVFHFSDSVMLAIQSCPRFALEVQPDSAISKMYKLLQNPDSLRDLEKMFSSEEYEKLAKKFKQKNGYDMGNTDPVMLESLLNQDNKPDDRQTFIDAYLYGIARTLNKGIYGLEDPSSQLDEYFGSPGAIKQRLVGVLDDNAETYKKQSKEDMTKIYSTGDINKIYDYIQAVDMIDSTIIRRNKVMASSIIKNMKYEPIFSAVGAAHLPGTNGVIALLQQAGYTVTQVKATFTGIADTYHVDYLKMNWPVSTDKNKGYSISFPGNPVSFNMSGLQNLIYPDLANGLYFGLYVVHKGTPSQPETSNEAFNSTIKLLAARQNNTVVSKRVFVYKTDSCAEIMLKNNSRFMRMRLVLKNNLMYHYYVGSKQNHLDQPLVDRYFNSFNSFSIAQQTAGPWVAYHDTPGAFSALFPSQPEVSHKELPSGQGPDSVMYTLNMYMAIDSLNSRSYLVEYFDQPPGSYLSKKEEIFDNYAKNLGQQGKLIGDAVKVVNDSCEGREINLLMRDHFATTIRMFIKGNRIYVLMKEITQAGLTDVKGKDPFLDSVKLLPSAEPEYYTYQPDSGNYKIQLAAKPVLKPQKLIPYNDYAYSQGQCLVNNPNSGAHYLFDRLKISPYFQIANTDSLYVKLVAGHSDYTDTLLKLDTVTVSGIKGRELLTMNKETKIRRRTRILLDGENYFYLTGWMDDSELYNNVTNTFFNSFSLTSLSPPINLASPKAEKITRDLASTDTVIARESLGALTYYEFKPADLHYIYAALGKTYPDDTSEYAVRINLIEKLKDIGNDTTISFLANLYPGLKGKDEVKASILHAIPAIDKKKGYDIYFKLLTTDPPLKAGKTYKVFAGLRDSIQWTAKHFEQLLPFVKDDSFRNSILGLAVNIAEDSDKTYKKVINDHYLALMAFAQTDIDNYLKQKDSADNDYSGELYNYMQLMKDFKFKEFTEKLTTHYLAKDPKGIYNSDAVVARIDNHLPNNPVLIKRLMDSLDTRWDLMEAYHDQKEVDKIPEIYRRPSQFAKLCLFKYIANTDDDDAGNATGLKLLGTVNQNGDTYYAFSFSISGDEKVMIGIAGPYKPGVVKLNFDKYYAFTDFAAMETDWHTQAKKLIKPLLDNYK